MADGVILHTKKNSIGRRLQRLQFRLVRAGKSLGLVFRRVDKNTVVFEAFHGSAYACSPKAIYEYMLTEPRFADYRFIWVFKDCQHNAQVANDPRTTLVEYESRDYYRAFARSRYWIVNSMLPLDIAKHPRKQTMVQCFHGTPLKRLRNDIEETVDSQDSAADYQLRNNLDTGRYDYFVSPSRYATEHFTSAFSLKQLGKEDIIIETGYPRNDFLKTLTTDDVDRIKTRLGIPADKKVLLYAPTWRDDQYDPLTGFTFDPRLDFDALQAQLGDDYVLLFRLHYNVADTFDFAGYEGFIYNVSTVDDINELYIISDVLMTDYSSVFFDFGNLRRPVLFYMYDQAHYQNNLRGFYLLPGDLPGDIVATQAEIVARLSDLTGYAARYKQKLSQFHDTYNYLDDGQAAKRVVDIITPV